MSKKKKIAKEEIEGIEGMFGNYVGDLLKKGVKEAGIDIDQMSPESYELIFGGMDTLIEDNQGANDED